MNQESPITEIRPLAPKKPEPRSRTLVREQTAKLNREAKEAKARGEKVGWSTAVFPTEICAALGLHIQYPENYSASIAAKHQAPELLEYAENRWNYPEDICSYSRINFAVCDKILKGEGDEFDLVVPDFLVLNNNSCGQVTYWYENLAKELNIPIIFFDTVFNYDLYMTQDEIPEYKLRYLRKQYDTIREQLEEIAGKKLDPAEYRKCQERCLINSRLFSEIADQFENTPSPLSGFDLFNYMAPMVFCRPFESTTEILEALLSEIKEHLANGTSTFPAEEKYRIYWEGIANWPYLSHNLKCLKNNCVNMVATIYVRSWALEYELGNENQLVAAYSYNSNNNNTFQLPAIRRSNLINKIGVDGMTYHMNRSCKLMSYFQYGGKKDLYERTGVPSISFDSDQSDPRVFSKAQFETRLQGLVEIMEENKKGEH